MKITWFFRSSTSFEVLFNVVWVSALSSFLEVEPIATIIQSVVYDPGEGECLM